MDTTNMPLKTSLFQVYLRLRPPIQQKSSGKWLLVEPPTNADGDAENTEMQSHSTHITLQPPNDSRKRAIERFGFTKIFGEDASQLEVFDEVGAMENIKGVLQNGRDGLLATLGVTGSGKSHTILGSKSQRGLTQMSLDVLFRSIGSKIRRPDIQDPFIDGANLLYSLQASDPSEAQIIAATSFLESIYGDGDRARLSRAQTPMSRAQTPMVRNSDAELPGSFPLSPPTAHHKSPRWLNEARDSALSFASEHFGHSTRSPALQNVEEHSALGRERWHPPGPTKGRTPFWERLTPKRKKTAANVPKETPQHHHRKPALPPVSLLPQSPDVSTYSVDVDSDADYAVLVSMYEVYNDRIFDLLSNSTSGVAAMSTRQGAALQKGLMRRPLLFKNTEMSHDRKVVAGLRKIVCSTFDEAMMVLETGLTERRVAGTGSNSVSSRSHGFFCIEVKKNEHMGSYGKYTSDNWTGSTLSIVDLAGSERARNAKTTGSTLAEAGKINESLMYLGQCLQVQSDCQHDGSKPIVPFRQCKLTELLFSNSFPSSNPSTYRTPQKAVMIVTADPQGDFNATSQILRYSALAREVTVPRIPSVTSTLANGLKSPHPNAQSGRNTPHDYFTTQELEHANHEIARLSEECNALSIRLAQEEIRRTEAELKLQAVDDKVMGMEQEIREEMWTEMEDRIEQEKERWRRAWEEERSKGEAYVDGKLEIMKLSCSPVKKAVRSPTKARVR